jgi:NAD-dependent SIR2 family protein deacetylase
MINTRVFTQNIDTLERLTGLPDSKIVEAHGSFASSRCILCKKEYDNEKLGPKLTAGEVVRCERAGCKGRSDALVKPDIVFFGEGLPKRFFQLMPVSFRDLCMKTSRLV